MSKMANQCADVFCHFNLSSTYSTTNYDSPRGYTRQILNAGYELIAGVIKKTLEGFKNFPHKIFYSYFMSVWCRVQLIALLPEAVRPRAIVY